MNNLLHRPLNVVKRVPEVVKIPKYHISLKAAVAELLAMALFVYIGCGTAMTFSSRASPTFTRQPVVVPNNTLLAFQEMNDRLQVNSSWGVTTALAFGLSITVLCYATAHLSGGQLNPAVTLGLALVGALDAAQAAVNVAAQVVGSILGAAFLAATIPHSQWRTLGSNEIAPGVAYGNALCGEIIMTFTLVSVVLETAVNKKSVARVQAPMAIGFSVFCAHAVLLPIDGCSINPARSLGPAIISGTWPGTFWVFVVGPLLGAIAAVPFHLLFRSDYDRIIKNHDPVDLRAAESFISPSDLKKVQGSTASASGDVIDIEAVNGAV